MEESSQLTFIFFREVGQPPTRIRLSVLKIVCLQHYPSRAKQNMLRHWNTFEIGWNYQRVWFLPNPKVVCFMLFHTLIGLNDPVIYYFYIFLYLLTLVTFHSKVLKRLKYQRVSYDMSSSSKAVQRTGMGSLPTHQQHLRVSAEESWGFWAPGLETGAVPVHVPILYGRFQKENVIYINMGCRFRNFTHQTGPEMGKLHEFTNMAVLVGKMINHGIVFSNLGNSPLWCW